MKLPIHIANVKVVLQNHLFNVFFVCFFLKLDAKLTTLFLW